VIERYDSLYIDGPWHKPASGQTTPVISPVTEERVDPAPLAGTGDVDYAVATAGRALRSAAWARLSSEERAAALEMSADGHQYRDRRPDIGEYPVSHPGVNKVAFTGSTVAGRRVGEICGRLLRPVTPELGGKSAAIVLDDADPDVVASRLARSSLLNNGQTCYLSTRILALLSRYDEVLSAIADTVSAFTVGDPLDPLTDIGPLVSSRQQARAQSYTDSGRRSGAIANDSDYGLGGTIWTADVDKGTEVARRLQAGTVGVNFYNVDIGALYGGIKSSGLGRELGPEGLASFQELKSIYLP
jgi:aldehyde dehydrogenase (NAD+)